MFLSSLFHHPQLISYHTVLFPLLVSYLCCQKSSSPNDTMRMDFRSLFIPAHSHILLCSCSCSRLRGVVGCRGKMGTLRTSKGERLASGNSGGLPCASTHVARNLCVQHIPRIGTLMSDVSDLIPRIPVHIYGCSFH